MENQIERGPERIPTKEEVMELISRGVESPERFQTLREIYDEQGLKLLDLRIEGKEQGETIEFLYTRKGMLPNNVPTGSTSIEVSYYQDGNFTGAKQVAIFNYENGEWEVE